MVSTAAFSIRVKGRVQGVWFRASTRDHAAKLGLCGWVCNEPDGHVLIHAEGDREALQKLIDWCHHGPPLAIVATVHHEEVQPEGFTHFVVRR